MSNFSASFSRKSLLSIAIACALLIPVLPAAHAQSAPQLDKHARKIEKRLARFRPGTYLDVAFRDSTDTYGSLGALSDASFQFTDADSNRIETCSYNDVARVKKAKEYIGSGSEPGRHIHLLVPLLIGAGAAAAAFTVLEVVH